MKKENNIFELKEENNLFIFSDNTFEVHHKSNDLNVGYIEFKKLIEQKKLFYQENNIHIKDVKNKKYHNKNSIKDQLINNSIRSIFLMITFLIIIFISSLTITNIIKQNEIKGGRQFWKNFENEIIKFSNKDIDAETQEKILISIKKIGKKYKPFLNEIKKIGD